MGGHIVTNNGQRNIIIMMACKCIEIREMTCRQAADSFDIPYSTLRDPVSGKVVQGSTSGPCTYLSYSEEGELVNFIFDSLCGCWVCRVT